MEEGVSTPSAYRVLETMPWKRSLIDRLRDLTPGTTRVAYVYERAEPGTFRYRCYNMAQAINQDSSDWSASYFFLSDLLSLDSLAEYADILVLVRVRFDSDVERLVRSFRLAEKPVFYDLDDHIFDLDATPLLVASLDQGLSRFGRIEKWVGVVGRIRRSLEVADAVLTTTDFLKGQIEGAVNVPVRVLKNFLNQEQWDYSAKLREEHVPRDSDHPIIGYFSGSASHNRDYQLAEHGLATVMETYPHARLRIAGYLDVPPRLSRFADRIDRLPFMDFLGLQRAIGESTLNLSPIQRNVFSHSKSELKYFEAAAAGTLTVASPAPVFLQAIQHGHNGFLADALDWPDVLLDALRQSPEERSSAEANALQHVADNYIPRAMAGHIVATLRELSS